MQQFCNAPFFSARFARILLAAPIFKFAQLSFTGIELYRCEISMGCNAKFCNFWMVAMATGVNRG